MRHSGQPRVVISGIGVVSPFGVGRERFWDAVSRGCSGTRTITEFDASSYGCQVAAPGSARWRPASVHASRAAMTPISAARE